MALGLCAMRVSVSAQMLDFLVRQAGRMREERVGPENADVVGELHAALRVAVLREDEAALAAEPAGPRRPGG